jgi:hypothetical protein
VIHNEVLLITSPEKAESEEYMVTRAYPVTDLVVTDADGGVNMGPLPDMLTNTVATKSWADNGGTGTLSCMVVGNRALLVLSQTQEVHEEIESTLEMLRKAGGLKTAAQDMANQDHANREMPPARPGTMHIRRPADSGGMGGMGMGGMGGGMGGMGGRAVGQAPNVISVIPAVGPQATPGGDADLLEGLKGSNAANQKAKVLHLKQRQNAGQNGGMGGMGGGGMGGMF